jgi:hypothetical protein
MIKGKKIKFICSEKELLHLLERPYPAMKKLPDWICNTPSYIGGEKGIDSFSDPNTTIKKCMPVFDAMTAGYHIPLISDTWVELNKEANLTCRWSWTSIEVVSIQKPEGYSTYPVPNGYHKVAFKWINPWIVKTPPGWSCLFTQPLHYDDLPFSCLPAIVDTDKHPSPIHLPFFMKKSFTGLIPKGTPLIQVIPFKREEFTSEFSFDNGFFKRQWTKAHSVFFDRYQKFFRTPKVYKQGEEKKCPFAFLHNKNK